MADAQTPPKHTNRLAQEKSPYLLQHAHNPVDWFPWGPEAFEKARSEDKLILLSIGYATCHWCHVMERESFENEATAAVLNEKYVAIKVDREERPDVDQIYMKALHATGQQGGWPLNMFLTPDLLPITGGTYFPPQAAHGRPSFTDVLNNINQLWHTNRPKLTDSAGTLHAFLQQSDAPTDQSLPEAEVLDRTFAQYRGMYDSYRGGFAGNGANKFPPSMGLVFLLEYYRRNSPKENGEALQMVEDTLDAMMRGGIYDQIGGGLSRYATDHDWLVPHFEKMLYDNALFLRALVECYRVTQNPRYKTWALDVCQYVARDMTAPEGAFYSAEDADSEGEEGKFYVWSAAEIEEVLSEAGIDIEDRKLLVEFWDVSMRGNFEGKVILNERVTRDRFLAGCGKKADEWNAVVEKARAALLERRSKRVRPLRDDKILTSWNALFISALAQAATAFQDRDLYERARRAADFIRDHMHSSDGSLYRRYREGEAGIAATLPDYALLANAHLDLYRAGFDPADFARARDLAGQIRESFADEKEGGRGAFFETRADSADLIVRTIETYDGVEPSGNAATARLFLTLALYGEDPAENRAQAEGIFRYCKSGLTEQGASHSYLGVAFAAYLNPSAEVAVVLPKGVAAGELFWQSTTGPDSNAGELPGIADLLSQASGELITAASTAGDTESEAVVPLLENRATAGEDDKATVYVCRNLSCERPVHTAADFQALLKGPAKLN
ncbi:MAG: thioredoxin domain-containing protein [bacterium]|nr:thioredoxin domain-containing protein [bacterium]